MTMTAISHQSYELGIGDDAAHRRLIDRLLRRADAGVRAARREHAELRRQRRALGAHERLLDPRDAHMRLTRGSGGVRPLIMT
ncbi:hypothetical protein [Demequina mangrovi]|uniref:Uncharacterized protein n=1 Tax=Demequina mangrovi TaxID=1043493 RepID=A0A1H7B8U0_9MICO|nr:hypothetical protein [Demequina mangrovi]SEJ70710.1 hypothetical protein SAMN05421637_2752 [Demequina mangrovi]